MPKLSRLNAITLLVLTSGCTPSSRRTPDDTLVVLSQDAMTSADPRYALSSYDSKLSKLVYAGLTAVDTDSLEPRLDLAERIDRVDATTFDVTLRASAKFSDGSPVTAADVAGTYTDVIRAGSDSLFHKGFAERFTTVVARDPHTVRFSLTAPLATFATDIDFGIVSAAKLGAGPYILRSLDPQHALLDRNPFYPAPAKVAHVEIKAVRNDAARTLMLVGGSADLIQNGVRLDLVDEIATRPRVRVHSAPSVLLTYLMMNNTTKPFDDPRVRRAIAFALDRAAIVKAKLGGRAVLATGLIPPAHWAYNANVAHYARDLAKAKQLLDEAGLRDPDGDGPLPRFTITYKTSSDAFRITLAKVIAAQLGDVGIAVDVMPFEFGTFFADIKKGNYQIASMQTGEVTEPDLLFNYFHTSRIPDAKNPDGGNRWRYSNAEFDKLVEDGRHELDRAARTKLYARAQQILADEVPVVPLWHEDNIVLTNQDVENYRIVPTARLIGLAAATKR